MATNDDPPILDLRQLCGLPADAQFIDRNAHLDESDKGFPCYIGSKSAGTTWPVDISIHLGEGYRYRDDPRRKADK